MDVLRRDLLIEVLNGKYQIPLKKADKNAFDRVSDYFTAKYIRERLRNKKAPWRKILRAMKAVT